MTSAYEGCEGHDYTDMSTMTNIDWSLTHTYTHASENTNVLRVPASDLSGVVSTAQKRIKAEDTGFGRHTYGVHEVEPARHTCPPPKKKNLIQGEIFYPVIFYIFFFY